MSLGNGASQEEKKNDYSEMVTPNPSMMGSGSYQPMVVNQPPPQ
jgi:hypothetical protein